MLVQNKESWRFSSAVISRAVGIWGVALILFIHPLLAQGVPAPQVQEKTRTMAGISPNENWSVDLQGAKDASDKDHRIYDFDPSEKENISSLNPQLDAQRQSENPTQFVLNANLESGENIGVAMCLIDGEGEEFGLKNTGLKAGENKIVWRIPEDIGGQWGAKGNGKPDGDIRVTRILVLRWPSEMPARVRFGGLEVTERELPVNQINVTFDPGTAKSCIVRQYKITSNSHDNEWHDPSAWKLQGSNDKQTWVDLDTQQNQTFDQRRQVKTYDFANEQAFSHYRLVVTALAKPSGVVGISELQIMAKADDGKLEPITESGTAWTNAPDRPHRESYRAFDSDGGSQWMGSLLPEGAILGYDPTTTPVPFFGLNQADKASFIITNKAKLPASVKLMLLALDTDGNEIKHDLPVEIPAEGKQVVRLPKNIAARMGVMRLKWEVADAYGGQITGENRLAVMEPAGRSESHRKYFLFGNGGSRQPGMLSQIGIDVIRMSDDWVYRASPDGGQFDWSDFDRQIEQADRHGFRKHWLTTYTPRWAFAKGFVPPEGEWYHGAAPVEPEVYRKYIRDLATHFKGKIDYYEIRNEVDLDHYWRGTVDQYIELQKDSFKEIRKADPEAKVMTSGFALLGAHGGRNLNPDIQERTIREAQDYFDFHAFHGHGEFFGIFQPQVDGELARIRTALKSPKPLFYTETSVISGGDWPSQVAQGDELIKKVVFSWARGAYAYEWFAPLDWKDSEMWGLCTWDYQAKPAYVAYNTLIKTLRGLTPQRQLELGLDQWAFVFADPEGKSTRQVVVFWRENTRLPDADVRFNVGVKASCKLLDQYGNETDKVVVGGQVLAALRNHPVYLVVENGEPITQALPMAVPAPVATFDTGSTLRLAAEIGNPSDSEGSVRIAWRLPPEFKGVADVPDQTVKLGGGVTKQIVTEVPIPADLRMPSFGTLNAQLEYSLVGVDSWKGTLNVPLQLTRMIPDGAATSRPADFILDTVDSVVNFFNADPGNADKVWTGPADLSAQAWLTREGDNLVFRCDVTDDIHDQPFMGGDSWKADGIQVAFTIPSQKGNWELGLYQTNAGQVMAHIFAMPADTGLENPWDKTPLKITRENGKTLYEATFPYARYGITDELLAQGVRFAFIVNDSDGKGTREGYIRLAEGIGEGKSTEKFPVIRFKSR